LTRVWTTNGFTTTALGIRSKPAYQRLIIMLVVLRLIYFGIYYIYRDGLCYGDTYIANADLKDGLLIENQAMLNAGFKTGDKIFR
jgi:regulator of sigma E protease